jgi:outer membrane immunogenic protein
LKISRYILTAAALMSSTAVYAADAIIEEAPVAVLVETYDWTGFYIGVNGGYAGGDFEHPFNVDGIVVEQGSFNLLNGSLDITASGFIGGGQVGYNWQHGQWVFGAEADIQASNVKGELSADLNINTGDPLASDDDTSVSGEIGTQLDYFGTLRLRAGYVPVERLLVYGTGGYAYGRTESYFNGSISQGGESDGIDLSEKNHRNGWTIGGGAEYAFTDNLSLKTEYLYTDLGEEELFSFDDPDSGLSGSLDSDVKFHTVRAGLNWKF